MTKEFASSGEVSVPKLLTEKILRVNAKQQALDILMKELTNQYADLIIESNSTWAMAHTMAEFPTSNEAQLAWDHIESKIIWKPKKVELP